VPWRINHPRQVKLGEFQWRHQQLLLSLQIVHHLPTHYLGGSYQHLLRQREWELRRRERLRDEQIN
jgi:hypothetical protein